MSTEYIPERWIPSSVTGKLALLAVAARLVVLIVVGTGLTVAVYQPISAEWFWRLVQWGRLVLIVPMFLFFGLWLNSLRVSLESAGINGFRYGAGWTVGGFFVPLLNFLMPYWVAGELWRASDAEAPLAPEGDLTWASAGPRGVAEHAPRQSGIPTAVWWGLFWVTQMIEYVIDAAYDAGLAITATWQYHVIDGVEIVADLAWVAASVWFIAVLSERTGRRVADLAPGPSSTP